MKETHWLILHADPWQSGSSKIVNEEAGGREGGDNLKNESLVESAVETSSTMLFSNGYLMFNGLQYNSRIITFSLLENTCFIIDKFWMTVYEMIRSNNHLKFKMNLCT